MVPRLAALQTPPLARWGDQMPTLRQRKAPPGDELAAPLAAYTMRQGVACNNWNDEDIFGDATPQC